MKPWFVVAVVVVSLSVIICLPKTLHSPFNHIIAETAQKLVAAPSQMPEFVAQRQGLSSVTEPVSLLAVGDISFSRGVEQTIIKVNNLNYPFAELGDFLSQADITFANLETPLTPGRVIQSGEMTFRSDPKMAEVLHDQGFDIVSLANNHTPNFGAKGLRDTFQYLDEAEVLYAGAGIDGQRAYAPVYLERGGLKFAFIAQNDSDVVPPSYRADTDRPGTAIMDEAELKKAIDEARPQADLVIVSMHSGTEYVPGPNSRQTKFARAAIDYGADLVIGHHPHVIQSVEEYQGKYIFYSLGNFVFDQSWSQDTADSLAVKFYFTKDGLQGFSLYPLRMNRLAQPQTADEVSADRILKRLKLPLEKGQDYFWADGELKEQTVWNFQTTAAAAGNNLIKHQEADVTRDGVLEQYILKGGHLTATQDENVIWQSPSDWWVEDFVVGDSNHDGQLELNIALWRAGNFGPSKPFWVEENDASVRQHLFVIKYENGEFRPLWGSSNLEQPNCLLNLKDVDNDGYQELIVAEGNYKDMPACQPEKIAVWRWNNWGFANEWRSLDLKAWFTKIIKSQVWE